MIQHEVFNSLKSKPSGFSTIMTLFLSIVSCLLVIEILLIPGESVEIMKNTHSQYKSTFEVFPPCEAFTFHNISNKSAKIPFTFLLPSAILLFSFCPPRVLLVGVALCLLFGHLMLSFVAFLQWNLSALELKELRHGLRILKSLA